MILDPGIAPLPARRGSVLVPGLPVLPPNVERHPVPGGGTRTVTLDTGDEVTLIDREGRQPCELVVFDAAGRSDPAIIGATGTGAPSGTQAILDSDVPSALRVRAALSARGCEFGRADAVRLFGGESRAGESASFIATAPATLVASAPGGPMPVDEQCAPTEIVLYVRRESRINEKPANGPPPPLAEPLIDLNIQPGQARAYEVGAGQLIHIVDVKGRECTDFQAFSLRALDRGIEREIDPTTTRTLMGSLYPGPGLYSKYYTVDHEPLLRARPGYVRAPRLVRPRLHRTLLRGHGIPRACELLGQHQRRRRAVWHTAARRMAGHQLLLQHDAR